MSNSKTPEKNILLNDSIGIALRSYSRAINKRHGWSGSLFREETKAKTGFISEFIIVDSKQWSNPNYIFNCFKYIHNNPIPKLAKRPENYKCSSAREYACLTDIPICSLNLGRPLWNALQGDRAISSQGD